MNSREFLERILVPAERVFYKFAPQEWVTIDSEALLLAIAGQESAWTDRLQHQGTARGFWQCEVDGAVRDVLNGPHAGIISSIVDYYSLGTSVYTAIAYHDPLAYAVARCALRADPLELPRVGDEEGAWQCYRRVWRPGKPDRKRWSVIYPDAADTTIPF